MAQKNLLPMILLGLITIEPKTGYDLKKDFETEIGEFWSVKHSQIYLELKRLQNLDEIKATKGYFGNKIEKTYYEITENGRKRLADWMDSYSNMLNISKDEFVLKLYFIQKQDDPKLSELLHEQYHLRDENLHHLLERKKLLFSKENEKDKHFGHYLILDHAIRREREYVNWLEETIKSLSV